MFQKNLPEKFNSGILLENCQQNLWVNEILSHKEIGEKIEKNLVKSDRIAEALIPTVKPSEELGSATKSKIVALR